MPSGSLRVTCQNHTGNSNCVTAVAQTTRCAGRSIRLDRKARHTAARPISHSMYCGESTRLVSVKSSTATKAASATVEETNRRALIRHSSSQPKAPTVTAIAAADTADT